VFSSPDEEKRYQEFLSSWKEDPSGVKKAFLELVKILSSMEGTALWFRVREGVSYSLRAGQKGKRNGERPYYALMDVVEDAGEGRWLSVCFYSDHVTDPGQKGNLIPQGLLNEDGYCFDVDKYDQGLISYLEARIREAHGNALSEN